jgi:hypothetical protein
MHSYNFFRRTVVLILFLLLNIIFHQCSKITESDATPPSITISFPITYSTVSEIVPIRCMALDNKGIKRVTLWVDGLFEGIEDQEEPYELNWSTSSYENGSLHNIVARATDLSGNVSDSDPVFLRVDNTANSPTKLNMAPIININDSFILHWPQSNDSDFGSYILYESFASDMSSAVQIFRSANVADTIYVVQGIQQNETRFYQLVITDAIGLKTTSDVAVGFAFIISGPTEGLVAYYPFNGNPNDVTENHNHAIVNGATLSSDRFNRPRYAYTFNGLDNYMQVEESPALEPTSFSVAFWMKTFTLYTSSYQTLIMKEDGWNDGYKIVLRSDIQGQQEGAKRILFTLSGPNSNNDGLINMHSKKAIENVDSWYQIVATYHQGGYMQIYINGSLDSEIQGPVSWDRDNSYELVFGRHSNDGASVGCYLNGMLDDIRIYDRVLTLQEIKMIYSAGL